MDETKSEPDENKEPETTRLVIFLPGIGRSTEKTIRVAAVTDEGQIETSRDDAVELSINIESRMHFKDASKNVKLTLVNGEANATVISDQLPGFSIFKAKWISGKTPLQSTQVNYVGTSI
jgi:hypothetical protein